VPQGIVDKARSRCVGGLVPDGLCRLLALNERWQQQIVAFSFGPSLGLFFLCLALDWG
jgi:hypothetical protein